jgi:hypothetical protein
VNGITSRTKLSGVALLHDPRLNRSLTFTEGERDASGLLGPLPEAIDTEQIAFQLPARGNVNPQNLRRVRSKSSKGHRVWAEGVRRWQRRNRRGCEQFLTVCSSAALRYSAGFREIYLRCAMSWCQE